MDKTLVQKKTMGVSELMWIVGDMLGIPTSILYIIANFGDIQSVILSVILIGYGSARLYYYVVQKKQAVKEKDYDLWFREMDKKERQLTFDKAQHKVNGQ